MDREQEEIQFLGFFGIFKEAWTILRSWTTIFSQITLSMILPLATIYLAHIKITQILFSHIMRNEYILDFTPDNSPLHKRASALISSELATFFLFKIAYLIFFVVLALLSTSAVVYTIASAYTARTITFRAVISVVPKVWKRLMLTFIWNFVIVFGYNVVSILLLFIGLVALGAIPVLAGIFSIVFLIGYLVGLVYITLIWHLASVVSVLEESYGLAAMAKSQALIKGKMVISFAVFFVLGACFLGSQLAFEFLVVDTEGRGGGVGARVGYGIGCLLLMSAAMLLGLVVQTILYFVCKSYHHENIDKSTLADHLGGYLGEYVPLKSRDVQLEHFDDQV